MRTSAMDKDRVAGLANDVAGKVENAARSMAGNAKAQATGKAREEAGHIQNAYGQAKDAVRDVADYAKDAYSSSSDTVRDSSQALAAKVQENPLGSVLIAGTVGFALGLIMMRPRR